MTEKTTAEKKEIEFVSVFDGWMVDGHFNSDAYRKTQIKDAVDGLYGLSQEAVNLTPDENVKTSMQLMEWLALNSRKLADLGQRFINGKRQIVYYCAVYTLGLRDKDERRDILKALPRLFNYELGEKKKTVSGAWKDVLSNCNGYPNVAKDVGLGLAPQKTFSHISTAVTWCLRYYPNVTHARRSMIRRWFDDYYGQNDGFGLDKVNPTSLTELFRENHNELTNPDKLALYGERKKDDNDASKAQKVLSGGENAPAYQETSADVQTNVREKLRGMGIPLIIDKDLTRLANALEVDVTRSDAMGDITQALDVCGTVKARLHSLLEQARVHAENAPKEKLPSVTMSKADFSKVFALAQPLEDFTGASLGYRDRKVSDIVFRNGNDDIEATMVPTSTFHKFRRQTNTKGQKTVRVVFS